MFIMSFTNGKWELYPFHMQPSEKFHIESRPLPEMQKAIRNYPGEYVPAIFPNLCQLLGKKAFYAKFRHFMLISGILR